MKLKHATVYLPLILSALASAHAATVTRTGTADVLTAAAAWSPAAAPTVADVATWDAASTLANATTPLTAALTWGGLNVSSAAGNVSMAFTGGVLSNFGAINTGSQNLAITTGAANSTLTFTSVTGTGTLTLHNGTANLGMTQLNTANALNFNGTLALRGGNATTSPGTTAGSFFYLGRTGITQASGTAFALDTGSSTTSAKDVILDGDAWNGKTINLTSLTGFGSLRSDSGSGGLKTLRIDQATDTTFNGLILSHTSGAGALRRIALEKHGIGKLTLAGLVGKQTATAGAAAADIDITVSAGTLVLTAQNTRTGATTVASGATLQAGDGGGSGLIGGSALTNNGALVFNYGSSSTVTISNVISGNGSISKSGAGTLALTGNSSSYNGNIDLTAGSIRLGPSVGSGTLTVRDGAFISTGLAATNGTSQAGSLVLEDNSESDFRVGLVNDSIVLSGTISAPPTGPHLINILGAPTSGGTIKLIDYTGTPLGTTEFSRFNLGITPAGAATYQLVNNTADTSIDLLITLEDQLWTGSTDGNWNAATTNWAMAGTPAVPVIFNPEHPSVFNDNPTTSAVIVGTGITPSKVTFNNSITSYVLSGEGIGGTGTLVKNGSATTTLEQANSYNGGTIVNQGTLRIGSGGLTGDIGSGAVSIASGATLEFNRSNVAAGVPDFDYKTNAKLRNVSGAGDVVLTGGAILFNYTGSTTGFADANSWVGFSGNLIIKGGSEFRTIRNGATAMGTGNVVLGDVSSSGILSFIEGNWTATNNLQLVGSANRILNRSLTAPRTQKLQGIISGSGAVSFEDPAATMTDVNRGFILTGSNTMDGTLTIAAGVPLRVGGIPGNVDASNPGLPAGIGGTLGAATVVNNGTLTFSRTNAHSVSNNISGTGAVRIGIPAAATLGDTTTQVLTYTGAATHTGTSTVNNGTLVLGTGSSLGGSAISVESPATLTGTGTAAAPLTSAGTIAPGTGIGILSVTGNTLITGTLAVEVDGTSGDKLSVTGDLTLTGSALTVTESGTGFTSSVIAECTGTLTGTPTVPEGYTVSISGNQLVLSKASGNTYANWALANAGGGSADGDFDADGTSNGVEYFMGETGSTFTPNPTVVTTAGVSTVTWPRDPDADADFKVQVSTTLATAGWTDIVPPNASIDESNPNQVVFTFPAGDPIKFCRLVVTVAP